MEKIMFKVNLQNEVIFKTSEIIFNKKTNFIYGRNGTGKSTLTKLIKDQAPEAGYETRIFQGFDNILGENQRLNAVILGEENNSINKKIHELSIEKENLEERIRDVEKNLVEPEDKEQENLYTKKVKAEQNLSNLEKLIDKFCSDAAAKIKNQKNPQISRPTYQKNNFKDEISLANVLSKEEKDKNISILMTEKKVAEKQSISSCDFQNLYQKVNQLVKKKVAEKIYLERLTGNNAKINFARQGLALHKAGEICAFCGNIIKQETINELHRYFDADEVKTFQTEIANEIESIEKIYNDINEVKFSTNQFYSSFQDEILNLTVKLSNDKSLILSFLTNLKDELAQKQANLFHESNPISYDIPTDLSDLIQKYNSLVDKNNKTNLDVIREDARDKLRYDKIKEIVDSNQYYDKEKELEKLELIAQNARNAFQLESNKIYGEDGYRHQINTIDAEINRLQESTRNEKILAERINKKLKHMVSFELVHKKTVDGQGFYNVKSCITEEERDILLLSTGEKNIIAFLYFIEKLNEIPETTTLNKRVIVFDDPMNSNDDNMQYLMIEELLHLMKTLKDSDIFILLTHNKHFYINVKYDYSVNASTIRHLEPDGKHVTIKTIRSEKDDFKTSYGALWLELKFLYKNENAAANMLLNPIRRIIETFTNFNQINMNSFCEKQTGALKLFHVNSHAIDDLEAETNGLTKDEIINIMKSCFSQNGALKHFEAYWNEVNKN